MPVRWTASAGHFLSRLFGGRLQTVLTLSFSLVAALTVGIGTLATSRVIADYLTAAEDARVARDMGLAEAFYQLKLDEVASISHRLVLDRWVIENAAIAGEGDAAAVELIDQEITNKITVLALGGTHLIAVLDPHGTLIVGRVLRPDGSLSAVLRGGDWSRLPICVSPTAGTWKAAIGCISWQQTPVNRWFTQSITP